jgi:uncharacterized repeat protein (TIGR03803 family)
MASFGTCFHAYRFASDVIKLPFKFVIAVLFTASASFVGAQTIQTICSFTNGASPSGLTLGNDGNFYGTTVEGGITNAAYPEGMGTVFQMTTNGTLNTLASFNFTNGANPSGLILGNDGNFYGTTVNGGIRSNPYHPQGMGTVFQLTTNGTLNTLASFDSTNGANPNGLTLGNDGNFYGTTEGGGITNYYNNEFDAGIILPEGTGTVFQVTTNGTLTTLTFFPFSNLNNNEMYPNSPLALGNDGNFYGTTSDGPVALGFSGPGGYLYISSYGFGMVFEVTTNGAITTLSSDYGQGAINLTMGDNDNFYGTAAGGGTSAGTVFQQTTNGAFGTLASFNFTNGAYPKGLTLGNDGNFYGTTSSGGTYDTGTVFQVTTNGTLTMLASFLSLDGAGPSGLTLGNDGNFYGTTSGGGTTNSTYPGGMGTIFRVALSLAFSVQPQSQTVYAGATATFRCATIVQPLGFQWQKNGSNLANGGNISGATSSTLTIASVSDSDAASYSVIATSAEGSASSSAATLTVNDSDFFIAEPLSQTVGAGSRVTFTAGVDGAQPFVTQWLFNGTPISSPTADTTSSSYTLTDVGTNQGGNYSLEVISDYGSSTSSNAMLTVIPQPILDLQILAGYPVLNLSGTPSNNFVVQYSTNLADTNWINLLSLTNLSTRSYLFLDSSGVGEPARFYRAFFAQ